MMDYIFNTTELDAMMKTWNASDIIFNFTSIQDPKLYFTIKPESGNNGACKLPSRLESVGAVAACQRDSRYFLKLAVELSFSYALYNLCFWYLLNHNFKDVKEKGGR